MLARRRKLVFVPLALTLALAAVANGCGQAKERSDKIITIEPIRKDESSDEATLKKLKEFYDLYSNNGKGISQQGMLNISNKYKDQLHSVLDGHSIDARDVIKALFELHQGGPGQDISPESVLKGLERELPLLEWTSEGRMLTREELPAQLAAPYPQASLSARQGLADALFSYDNAMAEGNGDDLLDRHEVGMPALMLAGLSKVDFGGVLQTSPSDPLETRLVAETIGHKLQEQVYARYSVVDPCKLPAADQQLEWMQLVLRYYVLNKVIRTQSATSTVPAGPGAGVILSRLMPQMDASHLNWDWLTRFYDSKVMGGDADGSLGVIEIFNLLTELDFAEKLNRENDYAISADRVMGNTLGHLQSLYPRVGKSLFMDPNPKHAGWARPEYWNSLKDFDRRELGGNGDGHLDNGEVAVALGFARVVDNLFAMFDINHDGLISKAEVLPPFRELGITDTFVVDAFFSNVGLDASDSHFKAEMTLLLSAKARARDNLTPFEFYVRLKKVLPRLLLEKDAAEGVKSPMKKRS